VTAVTHANEDVSYPTLFANAFRSLLIGCAISGARTIQQQ
jgi:hypothetical protein